MSNQPLTRVLLHRFQQWLLRKLQILDEKEKLVKVYEWWPPWRDPDRGDFYWPCGITMDRGGMCQTMSPIWDQNRFLNLFFGPPERTYMKPPPVMNTYHPWSITGNYGPKDPM